jgi:hypothetical protein
MWVKRRKSKERETFSLLLLLLRSLLDRGSGRTPKEGRIKRVLSGGVEFEEYHHSE